MVEIGELERARRAAIAVAERITADRAMRIGGDILP